MRSGYNNKIKEYIHNIITESLHKLGIEDVQFKIDTPKDEKYGDLSSNVALIISKKLNENPRTTAGLIIEDLSYDEKFIEKIEIAGAGFINFYISNEYYKKVLNDILDKQDEFGKSIKNKGRTANLEWVSANPTGLLHAGHGRQVCLGKAIANILEWMGYKVTREYYYNDAGNQMNTLAKSVRARYEQIFNPEFEFPEDGYHGSYITDIAEKIFREYGETKRDLPELEFFMQEGEKYNFEQIKKTLGRLRIKHDVFFNETELYNKGDIDNLLKIFKEKNLSYEKDGAIWLRMTDNGFEKDKVIVKQTGEPTYRLPDMAYHINKIKRGYDLILDIFGADHSDTYKEVLFGIKNAGYSIKDIKVIIHQMVTFRQGNESIKMSKRSDNVYYLDDLIKEVGSDATQFFFVMRAANTHLDFDTDLAKEQSDKNPVFYLQYAHARICGIIRNAEENFSKYKKLKPEKQIIDLLKLKEETDLMKILSKFPEEVESAADTFEPHRIITYLNSVAEHFHKFYHNNRVLDLQNEELSISRIFLCNSVKQVLKNGFDIIGISAPERM